MLYEVYVLGNGKKVVGIALSGRTPWIVIVGYDDDVSVTKALKEIGGPMPPSTSSIRRRGVAKATEAVGVLLTLDHDDLFIASLRSFEFGQVIRDTRNAVEIPDRAAI